MVRKLALSLAVASAIAAGQANALGLGEIRVNSALNEPLDADIRLVQVRDLSAQQILPRMADIDEFSLAGLTKSRFLSDVKFQVKVAPDGSGSIHVTSSVPVQEPFLSFLMEVNWPQGRLVREYTLLLDPPVFDPAPVTTAINAPAAVTPSATAPQAAAAPAQRSNIQTNVGGGEIFVNNNDTLYVLAKNNRPASDISIEQMMVAMQRKNPELFPTSNINVMRAGKVMKLPTAEEARALTRKQAIAEAARQTAEWKASRRAAAAPTARTEPEAQPEPAAPEAQSGGAPEGAPDTSESQLKIVTAHKPEETPAEMEESVSSDASAEAAEAEVEEAVVDTGPSEREMELIQRNEDLENRLLVTQESVDKVSRENAELGEKLDSIQEQLAAMQRLIELKDQQMAALQAEMLKQVQEANKPKPSQLDEFINMMMANPLYLGGAGGVLLLLLALAALARRRKSADYDEEPAPRKSKKGKKAKQEESVEDEIPEFDGSPAPAAAAATAATAAVAGAALANEAQADPEDDLDDLDLDMDLDLDDDPAPVTEIDLSEMDAVDESELGGSEIDSVLDEILDEDVADEPQEADDLDALLDSDSDDIDTDLDGLLEADLDDDLLEDDPQPADESREDDELEGLEFAIDDSVGEEVVAEEASAMIDEEFFSEEIEPESDLVSESDEIEEAELIDEPIEMDKPNEDALETVSEDDEIDDLVDDDLDKMLLADAAELESEEQSGATSEAPAEVEFEAPDLGIEELGVDEEHPPELESAAGLDQMVSIDDNHGLEEEELLDLGDFDTSLTLDDESLDDAEEASDSIEDLTLDDEGLLEESLDEAPAEPGDIATADIEESELLEELDDIPEADLDAMVQDLSDEVAIDEPERPKSPGEQVEDELTANIGHDLDMSLEDELDDMLAEDDGDIELVEEGDDEDLIEDDLLASLDGADEVETKLDLARAYIEMDDAEGARDILGEIVRDGNAQQQAEAQSLLDKLS